MATSENWTLGTIISRSTAALGNRLDIDVSMASFWANEAQRFVWDQSIHDAQELLAISSTTSGERTIAKPVGHRELLSLSIGTASNMSAGLRPLNVQQYDTLSQATGRPTDYLEYNDYLELYPTPDSGYSLTLRYRGEVPYMTSLSDVPSVATRFRYAVYLKTRSFVADEINDDDGQLKAENEFVRYMNMTPSDRALKQREKHYVGASLPRKHP